MGVDGRDRAAFLGEDVEEGVEIIRRTVLAGGEHAVHCQALVAALAADEHPRPVAADGGEVVVPAGDAAADLLLHPLAGRQVLQALDHLGAAALVGPGRDDAGKVVVAARVGVDVRLHIDAAAAGVLDEGDDLARSPMAIASLIAAMTSVPSWRLCVE